MRPLQRHIGCLVTSLLVVTSARALTFEYSFTAGTSAQAQAAFIAAGDLWSSVLSDNVTIRLTVGTAALGGGTLAQAYSDLVQVNYGVFRSALIGDATSTSDNLAIGHLTAAPSFAMLINRTQENGNSATPYLDNNGSANNRTITLSSANAAALGLSFGGSTIGGRCASLCDGFLQFNSSINFDYDRSNGITSGFYDFIGIAAHEIGHSLGFLSGVDVLDSNPGFGENQYTTVMPLDLFRYSTASAALGAIDFTASNTAKYFSLNGASSGSVLFSNGTVFGDGRQASHWKNGLGLGIMNPTSPASTVLTISGNDLLALDAIGWNLTAVPEPGRPALMALGLALLAIVWRRRARTAAADA